ncbi:MAG TPA: tRNA (adenosine(37)-N6)-threonylcarbamoyltransferase complex transferase subunit TsaD, partial [Clostridia bacterium]|nr:tRNA (adenosine(37)-N6)-threonylcarbamoyltransferase complex transferase subunit TsaD [Clostridia bacterium]
MNKKIKILGIETSCDETAASLVQDGRLILSSLVASQVDL